MTMPFAFLHQRCAFTLVSAVAIVFALIRSELPVSSARRLQVSDLVLGVAAGALLIDRVVARGSCSRRARAIISTVTPS